MNDFMRQKRILVTGINGQVGGVLKSQLSDCCNLITASRTGQDADITLDLADHKQLLQTVMDIKPDIIINPAAYTKVDMAEEEPTEALNINGIAPGVLAEACKSINATLVHYSTDYVFNGKGAAPYGESDHTDPINVYGETKLAGEQAIQAVDCKHFIFRACWVYNRIGQNFPNAILNRAKTDEVLRVVNDQVGTPTSANFIVEMTLRMLSGLAERDNLASEGNRIYNLCPDEYCSWFDFASEVIKLRKGVDSLKVKEILPVDSDFFPTLVDRPNWSVLNNDKIKSTLGCEWSTWKSVLNQEMSF
jgi:dTDP-4-dehydrorhamnose reductase